MSYFENYKKFQVVERKFAGALDMFNKVSFASKDEDIFEHWDVKIDIKIDVKAMKKINREDSEPNENIHYVEIRNVHGDKGWLYGQADYFAFEMKDYYVMVSKIKLQAMIANRCKDKIKCARPTLYQLYSREGRSDMITLVKTVDLIFISDKMIEK
jgi:hypothetical protein